MTTASSAPSIESAAELSADERQAIRDLLLTLADNKRLLGIRYADCMLGSPSLESGIAASSMAQDEWGHGRLTYALLSDLGDDPAAIEHDRESEEYRSMAVLDRSWASWTDMIAAALVVDPALTIQYQALFGSRYAPARNRVEKLLDEEVLHFQYAVGWVPRLAASQLRDRLAESIGRMLREVVHWFGADDEADAALLAEARLTDARPDELRGRYLERLGPVLAEAELAGEVDVLETSAGWRYGPGLTWQDWDAKRRRFSGGGPDPETLARVRGDLNREMLLD